MSSRLQDTHLDLRVHAKHGLRRIQVRSADGRFQTDELGRHHRRDGRHRGRRRLTLGLLNETVGINPTAGVGAAVGVVGALLIGNRARAVAAQKNQKP